MWIGPIPNPGSLVDDPFCFGVKCRENCSYARMINVNCTDCTDSQPRSLVDHLTPPDDSVSIVVVTCILICMYGPQVLSTCPLHTISGFGKERRILTGPW